MKTGSKIKITIEAEYEPMVAFESLEEEIRKALARFFKVESMAIKVLSEPVHKLT